MREDGTFQVIVGPAVVERLAAALSALAEQAAQAAQQTATSAAGRRH